MSTEYDQMTKNAENTEKIVGHFGIPENRFNGKALQSVFVGILLEPNLFELIIFNHYQSLFD